MAEFQTVSWPNGFQKSIDRFKSLKRNGLRVVARKHFQRTNVLLTEFTFDNGEFVIIPNDVVEDIIANS